jgi:hypothetical protein
VIGDGSLLTGELTESLNEIANGVDVVVGAVTESLEEEVHEVVPDATTFLSGLQWLGAEETTDEAVAVGRLLLVDRSTILVSSIGPDSGVEHAVFGTGFGNGLVVIARRLMSQGLLSAHDPG